MVSGLFAFISASLGIFARDNNKFNSMTFSHLFFGLFLGIIACFIFSRIEHKVLKKYSFYIFLLSILVTILVFVPGIGLKLKGASRWIYVFGTSIQPVEFLKIGFLVYWSAWLAFIKDKVTIFKYSIIPFIIIMSILGLLLLLQPDFDSFLILGIVGFSMLFVSGAKWKHLLLLIAIAILVSSIFLFNKDYAMNRVLTFVGIKTDTQNFGYQVDQSSIAIGSGQLFGRGYGQGIQKYKFLPETVGDSIFAVIGEEAGFVGSSLIIFLFIFFMYRGLRISREINDTFGGLLSFGIVILIMTQSFLNIGSMLGVFPLAGTPLVFFSHGGTAMFSSLIMMGILLSISRNKRLAVRTN